MKRIVAGLFLFLALQACLLAQNINFTVSFDPGSGINGGNPISLVSFKIGVQQSALISQAGGGASAGRSQFTPMTIFKSLDQTTPQLFLACALGKVIKNATLTVSSSQGTIFQIVLTSVIISAVDDDSTNSDGAAPLESCSLSYNQIGWKYTPLNGIGEVDGAFDVKRNVSLSFTSLVPPQ